MDVMLIPIVISLGFFGMVVAIVFFRSSAQREQMRMQAEVQAKLIDRFQTGSELTTFLQSPEGKGLLGAPEGAGDGRSFRPSNHLIEGVRRGVTLTFLGSVFLILSYSGNFGRIIFASGFAVAGWILLALGLANFVSLFVVSRLSKTGSSAISAGNGSTHL